MEILDDLGIAIRDALLEARTAILATEMDYTAARDLMKRLLHLADAAHDAGYPFSEAFLETAADDVELLIDNPADEPGAWPPWSFG